MLCRLLALCLLLAAPAAKAADGKTWWTYPMPPHSHPDDPMRINPAFEVPQHPERYVWKVAGKVAGKAVFSTAVPAYTFDPMDESRSARHGEVPLGTEIKLDLVRRVGNVHFYGFPFPDAKNIVWINGLYIEPAGYTPPVQ